MLFVMGVGDNDCKCQDKHLNVFSEDGGVSDDKFWSPTMTDHYESCLASAGLSSSFNANTTRHIIIGHVLCDIQFKTGSHFLPNI
jgi:hypothetical protein